MLLPTLILLCVSTQAIHTAKIVKRDLLHSLKLEPSSYSLRYPVHPTVQTPTPYGHNADYGSNWNNNPVDAHKLRNPFTSYISNPYKSVDPFYHGQNRPQIAPSTYHNSIPGFRPDLSVRTHPFEPVRYHHQDERHNDQDVHYGGGNVHKRDVGPYVSGGIPDFGYETTRGMSAPQPGKDYIPHPLEFRLGLLGIPQDHHRLKQGYSPVHYRYNGDDDDYSPVDVECNKYHCPL